MVVQLCRLQVSGAHRCHACGAQAREALRQCRTGAHIKQEHLRPASQPTGPQAVWLQIAN